MITGIGSIHFSSGLLKGNSDYSMNPEPERILEMREIAPYFGHRFRKYIVFWKTLSHPCKIFSAS